jgi:predicted AlkP superfamily pyrophosphatase or phosphodiesterase
VKGNDTQEEEQQSILRNAACVLCQGFCSEDVIEAKKITEEDPQPRPEMTVREGGEIIEENGSLFVTYPRKPYFYTKNHVDIFLNGLNKNERVGAVVIENLKKYREKRFFFFIHFAEPDHAGHAHGENSREYTKAIKSDDEWTGKIVANLRELGLYEKTLVYITADQGFDEGKTEFKCSFRLSGHQ